MTRFKTIKVSSPAEIDLNNISNYTLENWGKLQKDKYLSKFKLFFQHLSLNDEAVLAQIKDRGEIEQGIMSYRIGKHQVFFRTSSKETVVLRVLHLSMDA